MTTANTWTREDQRLARLKQADEFAAQEIARMLAEIERGWAEIERLTDLGGDDAVRAAQATEIDRLTEHLAHTRDAANKLYQAAAAFCEGWDHEAITLCFGGLTREQFEALLAALDPCEREATRRDGLERELAALRADVAEKSAEVAATMRRHREEKDALDREVASLRSTPIGQALDLLRRTRAVLHRLDPAHEKLRGEIDALLAGAPVVETEEADASRPGLTEEEAQRWGLLLDAAEYRRDLGYAEAAAHALLAVDRGEIPPDVRPVAPFTEEEARRSLGAALREAAKQNASRATDVRPVARPTLSTRALLPASDFEGQSYPPFDARHSITLDDEIAIVRESWHDAEGLETKSYELRMRFPTLVHLALNTTPEERDAIDARADWRGVPDARPVAPHTHPLTEEEARIARGLHACAGAWEPDVRLIGNLTAREIERFASAILSRGEIPPDVRPVAPFTEEEARRSLGAALREAAKQNAIYSPMCAVRAGADVGRVAPKVEEPMLTPAEEADVIAGAPAQIAPHGQSEIEILRAAVVRAHERIDALEKKPVEATIAAMAAQIERLDAEMRHVLVTIARDPKVEGDDVEAEEDPRTRLHEGDPEGKPSTLKERLASVVRGTTTDERLIAARRRVDTIAGVYLRHVAYARLSCSWSSPSTAVDRGAKIEGDEVVWPDGERYPIAPENIKP